MRGRVHAVRDTVACVAGLFFPSSWRALCVSLAPKTPFPFTFKRLARRLPVSTLRSFIFHFPCPLLSEKTSWNDCRCPGWLTCSTQLGVVENRDFGGFKRTMISYRFHAMSTRPHRSTWPKTPTRISASMQCKRCVSRDSMFYSSGHVLVRGPIRAQDRRRCRWSERKTLWRKAKR